jgi:DivIVA domain-containing protein
MAPGLAVRSLRSLIYLLVRVAGSLMSGKRATIVCMGQLFIVLAVALVAAALVFGVTVLIMGGDQGLEPAEPDGRAVPLPGSRPLTESDIGEIRFDITLRGYRMAQVDQALRRAGYDLGYKEELIDVLEAEVDALRSGRIEEADAMRAARETASRPGTAMDDLSAVDAELAADAAAVHADENAPAVRADGDVSEADADDDGAPEAGDGDAPRAGAGDADASGAGTGTGAGSGGASGAGEAAGSVVADGERAGDQPTPGDAVADAGRRESTDGGAELDDRAWPDGLGKVGDPAAEPAK